MRRVTRLRKQTFIFRHSVESRRFILPSDDDVIALGDAEEQRRGNKDTDEEDKE